MRHDLTRERLHAFMRELARSAPRRGGPFRVFLVGGGTAVWSGWRPASVDVDIHADREEVLRDIQAIKERLDINVELARPEHFVPALPGTDDRHVFIETIPPVSFYHYDPYAQALSKVVRGFDRDLVDARHFVESGMVEPEKLRKLVERIPESEFSRYPHLARRDLLAAIDAFAG
jgi:hypothetical protein